jgi:hypothetical protein
MMKNKQIIVIVLIATVLISLGFLIISRTNVSNIFEGGTRKFTTTIIVKTKSFAPGIPIKIESILPQFTQPIKLGDEIDIIFKVSVDSSYGMAKNVTATIAFPEGLVFVGGTQSWNGDLKPDEPISFDTKIKIIKTGNWTLEAVAEYPLGGLSKYVDRDKICFSITQNEVIIAQGEDACLQMFSISECKDTTLPDGTIIRCTSITH